MTTPTPMARAVDMACDGITRTRKGGFMGGNFEESVSNGLRAALPALLEAVMGVVDVSALRERMEVAGLSLYHKDREDHARAALLAALTNAAGRVG